MAKRLSSMASILTFRSFANIFPPSLIESLLESWQNNRAITTLKLNSCPGVSNVLSRSIVQKYPVYCPRVSSVLSRSIQCIVQEYPVYCPGVSSVLSRSIQFIVQEYPVYCPGVSSVLCRSIQCIVQEYPMYCPGVSNVLSRSIQCIVQEYCPGVSSVLSSVYNSFPLSTMMFDHMNSHITLVWKAFITVHALKWPFPGMYTHMDI